MHEDRGVVFYHTHSCAQCFEKDVVHLAQQWYNEENLSFTRGFDPQALRLCIRLLQYRAPCSIVPGILHSQVK